MNWTKIDKVTIFKGTDENGNRYLGQFLKDYAKTFNVDVTAGCRKCLDDYYNRLIKHLNTMGTIKNTSGYKLREKYNGIPLAFGSAVLVNNTNITKEQAEHLIKNHVLGAKLFDEIPEQKDEIDLKKIKRAELDEKAKALGLNPEDYNNKQDIFDAILKVENTEVSSEEE